MFKRILVAIMATLLVGVLVPAPAYADGEHKTDWECIRFDGGGLAPLKETCVRVWFNTQVDGTGVRLEYLQVDTISGCTAFDPIAWWKVRTYLLEPQTNIYLEGWDFGNEAGCDYTKDYSNIKGFDTGATMFALYKCGGDDNEFKWKVVMRADGSSYWTVSNHDESSWCKDNNPN